MRRALRLCLATATALFVVGATQLAGISNSGAAGPTAYQRMLQYDAARQARMVSRRLAIQRSPGFHLAPAAAPSRPGLFDKVSLLQRIARDHLKGDPAAEPDTEVEADIAMDPNNAQHLVAGAQQGRFQDGGSVDPGFAASKDGGKTWKHGNLPGLTVAVGGPYQRSSDVAFSYGPHGEAYATTIPFDATTCRTAVSVQRSDDGGFTWGNPAFPTADNDCSVFNDKNWQGVDTTPSSPFYGRVYVVWSRFHSNNASPGVLQYSDDRGATWSKIFRVTKPGSHTEGLLPLVRSNGDVTMVFDSFVAGVDTIRAATSTDGGESWTHPVTINTFEGTGLPDERTGGLPDAAIDPITGTMYAVWQDTRFRTDGLNDIVISSSTDGGATWSALQRVNTDATDSGIDHFTPAVAAYGGIVHVDYDTRAFNGTTYSNLVFVRYIHSADGGVTFISELPVGPPSDLTYAAQVFFDGTTFLGDYQGLVAGPGAAHPAFPRSSRNPDDPSAIHQTLWSASIR